MMFSSSSLCAFLLMVVLPSVIYGEILFLGKDPGTMAYWPTPIPFKCVEGCDNYNDGVVTIPKDATVSLTLRCPHPPNYPYDRNYYVVGYSRNTWHSSVCSPLYDDSSSYHENGTAFCVTNEMRMEKGDELRVFYLGKDNYSPPGDGACTFEVSSEEK